MADPSRTTTAPVRITVGNLKGGTGRSTTALYLSLALARRTGEPVMLVDADGSNGTSYEWREAAGDEWPSLVTVTYWATQTVAKRVQDANPGGHLIIDTAPHDAEVLAQALTVTDHLIMPMAPHPQEVVRVRPTLEVAARVGVARQDRPLSLSMLFTRTVHGTVLLREARATATTMGERMGFTVHQADVPFLQQFPASYGSAPRDLSVYPGVLDEIMDEIMEGTE